MDNLLIIADIDYPSDYYPPIDFPSDFDLLECQDENVTECSEESRFDSSAQTDNSSNDQQYVVNAVELMPHEYYKQTHEDDSSLDDVPTEQELVQFLKDHKEACESQSQTASDENAEMGTSTSDEKKDRIMGWVEGDDERLYRLIVGAMEKHKSVDKIRLNWGEITDKYNMHNNQQRTKCQIYSHFRYTISDKRRPSYSLAEVELMLALDDLGMPPKTIALFLKHNRSEEQVNKKLEKLRANRQHAIASEHGTQSLIKFRQLIQNMVIKAGWSVNDDRENKEIPQHIITRIQEIVAGDPRLTKKYHTFKRVGRPPLKRKREDEVQEELATLLRCFVYIKNRRRRTKSLPGDGRKYGLNLFALHRLLGSTLLTEKMPSVEEEMEGVPESEQAMLAVTRNLITQQSQEQKEKDRESYFADPCTPPVESLLPPTLFTMTGLRGMLLFKQNLKRMADGSYDERSSSDMAECSSIDANGLGDSEADGKFLRLLFSVFYWPFKLIDVASHKENRVENSDAETESEDEMFCKPRNNWEAYNESKEYDKYFEMKSETNPEETCLNIEIIKLEKHSDSLDGCSQEYDFFGSGNSDTDLVVETMTEEAAQSLQMTLDQWFE